MQKVSLLMLTTESRFGFFKEALSSVLPHLLLFDSIYISCNGKLSEQAHLNLTSLISSLGIDICLNFTGRMIPAVAHAREVIQKIRPYLPPNQSILLLADDDIISPDFSIDQYVKSLSSFHGLCLGMGNFSTFESDVTIFEIPLMNIKPGEYIRPLDFLRRNQFDNRFTNMSTMLVPFCVLDDVYEFMYRLGSSGRRFEYMLASSAKIKMLYCPSTCTALIRKHPGQEGQYLSHSSRICDELIYILWIWKNQPKYRPWRPYSFFAESSIFRFIGLLFRFLFAKYLSPVIK